MSSERVGERLVNVGFGNVVVASRVVGVVAADSAPMKRLVREAREGHTVIDATQGRKTRSIIVTDSGHLFLSAIQVETVAQRLEGEYGRKGAGESA